MDVQIRPLEWKSVGTRRVQADPYNWNVGYILWLQDNGWKAEGPEGYLPGLHESLEDAKAAAQADYEQRILAALATPPAPQQGDTATEQTGQKPGERAAQGFPADEQSGETSPAAQQEDIPAADGYVLVPVEPTEAMIEAGLAYRAGVAGMNVADGYQAMINARPASPAASQGGTEK